MLKLKPSSDNRESRMNFVKFWADYVRTHSDQEWGDQQTGFINAVLKGVIQPSPEEYLKLKGEICTRKSN